MRARARMEDDASAVAIRHEDDSSPAPAGRQRRRRSPSKNSLDTATAPSSKRHKTRALACRECRDRKVRCDGTRPVCDTCRRRGWGRDRCIYPDGDGPIASSTSYVRALQKRVNELESLQRQRPDVTHELEQIDHPQVTGEYRHNPTPPGPGTAEFSRRDSARYDSQAPKESKPPTTYALDDSASSDTLHSPAPLGQSSYASFMVQAEEALARQPSGADSRPGSYSRMLPPIRSIFPHLQSKDKTRTLSSTALSNMMLPPRAVADELLQSYWDWDNAIMPFVHRTLFDSRYRILWEEAGPGGSPTFDTAALYCLLAAMIAVGQLFTSPTSPQRSPDSVGWPFYERAKSIIFSDLLETGSLQVVQALLLMTRFLRRTNHFHQSWVFAGLAHRIAEGMELYVPLRNASQAEREERRRTWCACNWMVRMQNIAYGYLATAGLAKILPLPQEVDDEYMSLDASQPDNPQPADVPSRVSFYVKSVELSDIVNYTIRSLSLDSNSPQAATRLPSSDFCELLLELDRRLQVWQENLPDHLRALSGIIPSGSPLERQYFILRCRFLEARILVFRTEVMRLAKSEEAQTIALSTPLRRAFARGSVETCLESIKAMVDTVSMRNDSRLIPPRRHMIYCFLTNGTILAMILRLPFFRELFSNDELAFQKTQFYRVLRCLEAMEQPELRMPRKPADILRSMLEDGDGAADTSGPSLGDDGDISLQHYKRQEHLNAPAVVQGGGQGHGILGGLPVHAGGIGGGLQPGDVNIATNESDVWASGNFADVFGYYANLSEMGLEDLGMRGGPGNVMSFW